MTVQLRAYAKINLYLDVTGKRADGYHDILSVMQTVSLYDDITVTAGDDVCGEITLSCDSEGIPCNEKNLAYRAADAFFHAVGYRRNTHIEIKKRIPVSAGLAGGSTDAAAVLRGMNLLFGKPFDVNALCEIGKTIGADIPFCIVGGTSEVKGIGEQLLPLPDMPPIPMVLTKQGEGVSTPQAYRMLDALFHDFSGKYHGGTAEKDRYANLLTALQTSEAEQISKTAYNVFEQVILPNHSKAAELKAYLHSHGALASMMSGSGPSVFGLFEEKADACKVAELLNQGRGAPIAFAVMPVPKYEF